MTKMKRKYEDSPNRSNERNHKVSLHTSKNKSLNKEIQKASNKNTANNALRRSTRKATIERRVWAEPRREKQIKISKDFHIVSKRGRPKKKIRASKIFPKNILNAEIVDKSVLSYQTKDCLDYEKPETTSIKDEISSSVKYNDAEIFNYSNDKIKEETLVIDDQISSLHGAIVDEVIEDYPIQVSQSSFNSHCQKNVVVNSVSKNAVDNLFDNLSTNKPLNLTVSSKSICSFTNIRGNMKDNFESKVKRKTTQSLKSKDLVTQSSLSNNIQNIYKESIGCNSENYLNVIKDLKQISYDKTKLCNENEDKKDDNHVSLSEALAKLVDSEESGHGSEPETVTIHPFSTSDDLKQPYNHHITLGNNISIFPITSTHNSAAVIIPADSSSCFTRNSTQIRSFTSPNESECGETDEKESSINSNSSHNDEATQGLKSPLKHPVPPLIKISRSPVIKTPLKCSECPMRFCTVRSLLWHFGTHEPFRKNTCKTEIILEDLLASWDKPDVPVQILKRKDNENCKIPCDSFTECKYFSCNSDVDPFGQKIKNQSCTNKSQTETSRDFILKVPIPKLMHKTLNHSFSENSEFRDSSYSTCTCSSSPASPIVSIIPRPLVPSTSSKLTDISEEPSDLTMKSNKNLTNANVTSTTANTYQEPMLPSTTLESYVNDYEPYSPQQSVNTYSVSTSTTHLAQTSESSRESIKANKTPITVIPVEELGKLRRQIQSGAAELKDENRSCREISESPLVEEDGLVMINSGLALRIVSSAPSEGLNSMDLSPSCLTILPQNKDDPSGLKGRTHGGTPPPDILTIVPQSNPGKNCLKSSPTPSPQLMTAVGKVSADASQVVKLILVPPKGDVTSSSNSEKHLDEGWESSADISDVESDEGEMVIDIKEEEASMDPLSMCAVTMEEEFNEVSPPHDSSPVNPAKSSKPNSLGPQSTSPTGFVDVNNLEEPTNSNNELSKRPMVKLDEEKYLKRKYVCRYCQKRFGWSTDLKRHVILHTGERPFKCKWCPITFTRKFLLQNHMKKIHSQLCKWSDLWE